MLVSLYAEIVVRIAVDLKAAVFVLYRYRLHVLRRDAGEYLYAVRRVDRLALLGLDRYLYRLLRLKRGTEHGEVKHGADGENGNENKRNDYSASVFHECFLLT